MNQAQVSSRPIELKLAMYASRDSQGVRPGLLILRRHEAGEGRQV